MHRFTCLVVILLAAAAAGAESPVTIEVVLDASAAMNRPGPGGSSIHARVREAMATIVAEAAELQPGLKIGLRLTGGDPRTESLGSCAATSLVLPPTELDREQWLSGLDAIEPWGLRPLIASTVAALGDLDPAPGNRRIVIVTSGDDECGLGPQQVAAALTTQDRPTELRMVGLGLDQGVAEKFGAVPLRTATTTEELLAALRWAVLDTENEVRPTGVLHLMLATETTDPLAARVDLADTATGKIFTETVTGEADFDLPAGRYSIAVAPETGGLHKFRDLLIPAGTETRIELDLNLRRPTAIDVGTDPIVVGAPTWIDIAGFVPDRARLLFVDANGLAVSPSTDPFKDDGWGTVARLPGPLDLLLVGPEAGGVRRVLATRPIIAITTAPSFTAPKEIGIGEEMMVEWSGAEERGDFVGLVRRSGVPTDALWCAGAGTQVRARLNAPPTEAELDLIYVVGVTMSVAARHPIKVTAPLASVSAPARTAPGETIEVKWTGPENDEDFLSLAETGSPDAVYIEWARTEDGNPAVFRVPGSPGSYEVRYVDGRTGEARARTPVEIVAVPTELLTPATARAGMRFEIGWTGPDSPGDMLAIAKPGADPDRWLDWAPTTIGSPLTLVAPSRPGTYEVRYVAKAGSRILATAVIKIRP